MSNIIDGHDIGMGYEKVYSTGNGLQWWDGSQWVNATQFILSPNTPWRRPLPIISQHPGAIPLEPGEELKVGERYLQADGTKTGPLIESHDKEHPFHCPILHQTWTKIGLRSSDGLWPETNLIARLPKVEQKEPEKAKEEKVENQIDTIPLKLTSPFAGVLGGVSLSEAARIAQLPEVIAEVERQRAEKEIGKGDWFRNEGGGIDKCRNNVDGIVVGDSTGHESDVQDCTKIPDPAFIALLENGVGNG